MFVAAAIVVEVLLVEELVEELVDELVDELVEPLDVPLLFALLFGDTDDRLPWAPPGFCRRLRCAILNLMFELEVAPRVLAMVCSRKGLTRSMCY